MASKPTSHLTLKDRLSQLNFLQACQLLGDRGRQLIQRGSGFSLDVTQHVRFSGDVLRITVPDWACRVDPVVTITLTASDPQRLHFECAACDDMCVHIGAAISLILEEKMLLGLAAPPPADVPLENLSEEELVERAIREREERARNERMMLRSADPSTPWTDYTITNPESGKTYRVAIRGLQRGQSYCSCPDFRTNTLGTCKHLLHAIERLKQRFSPEELQQPYLSPHLALHLRYGPEIELRLECPALMSDEVRSVVEPIQDRPITDIADLMRRIQRLQKLGHDVLIYPDAEEFIQQRLYQARIEAKIAEIRRDPANHPLRTSLLKVELLPYQLDGVAFAVGAGRAILADDMGLGKTIQAVGVAELLAREAEIRKVLVICPASLKSQWRAEIERFSDRPCQLILGNAEERGAQYNNDAFFTICNYEQVLRDIHEIERVSWDLIILDEAQRIKNWEAKTSQVVKALKSPFALALSGTPLENRLDELYSVVQFIDDRRLAPAFRFFHRHRIVDERGKVLGYKNLGELRENLKPILLRRTRGSVLSELPPRSVEIIRVAPTEEQKVLHASHMQTVLSIANKKHLTEMDLLRLQRHLLYCRLAANSTILVNKEEPGSSSKLEELARLIDNLFAEEGRKVVLFSEWKRMLDLIEPLLIQRGLGYVRLDGSVPQNRRLQLVDEFQRDDNRRLFITTNAGSTGLNLQAANTVINVDLPWNPAVLEQRIARVHRMGQQQPVQVYLLVTEDTLEEKLLATLSSKADLALAALDAESGIDRVDVTSGMEELKRRLEVLLGTRPEMPSEESLQRQQQEEARRQAYQQRVAAAGGELLGAAFHFLGELIEDGTGNAEPPAELTQHLRSRLAACVQEDASGRQQLTVTLPDRSALDRLARSLAKLLTAGGA